MSRPRRDSTAVLAALQRDMTKLATQLAKLGKRISQQAQAPSNNQWNEQPQGTRRQAWADMDSDTDGGAEAPSGTESDASNRRPKKKKVGFSEDEQVPPAGDGAEALWITIGRLVEQAKGCATPPSDQEIRAKLQSIIGPKRRQPRNRPARAAADATPASGRAPTAPAATARRPPAARQAPRPKLLKGVLGPRSRLRLRPRQA